jgi:hypothetical protein
VVQFEEGKKLTGMDRIERIRREKEKTIYLFHSSVILRILSILFESYSH